MTATSAAATMTARRRGFRTVAYSLAIVLVGANLPTPLYAQYQRIDHLSTALLTVVFTAYVVAVMVALVIAGKLSDRYGRRAVLLPALLLAMASAAAFAISPGLGWLLVGRVTSGLASGAVTAVAPAALAELEPDSDLGRASVVASAATVVGLALGPMISGLFVQYGPWPTQLVFAVQLLALLPALAGARVLPPAGADRWPALATRGLRLPRVPLPGRAAFVVATFTFCSGWVATAMFFALGPTFAALILHTDNQALAAGVVFLVFATSAAAQLLSRHLAIHTATVTGLAVFIPGMAALPIALATHQPAVLLLGAVAAGTGQGLVHRASQARVIQAAPIESRAQTVSAFYLAGYLAIAVLLVSLGVTIDVSTPLIGLGGFTVVVIAAATTALVLNRDRHRPTAEPG